MLTFLEVRTDDVNRLTCTDFEHPEFADNAGRQATYKQRKPRKRANYLR